MTVFHISYIYISIIKYYLLKHNFTNLFYGPQKLTRTQILLYLNKYQKKEK